MRIFLTGGTGFIGAHVVNEMLTKGHSVTILAREVNKIPALHGLRNVKIIKGDVADAKTYQESLKGQEVLIHIALNWGDTAVEMLLNDTLSSVQLFQLAAKAGVKNIIYTSSTAVNDWVYMDDKARALGEEATVFEASKQNPVTHYGATKGATELFLQSIAFEYKITTNCIRPGYTFGNPAIEGASIEADNRFVTIVKAALANEPIEIIKNDGTQFIDAGDLSKIYSAILETGIDGKMYFGLGNRFITWEDVAFETIALTQSKSELVVKDLGWPEAPALFDVAAIKRDFGFSFDSWRNIVMHLKYLIEKS
ncbi:MAG: NAD-dependent epimerase/dehydratase family protein [Prolixibacteraceae bacterium]